MLSVPAATRSQLAPWTDYARRLGENVYDNFGVAHRMRMLFDAQFMRASNPEGFERFNRMVVTNENRMSADVRAVLREWEVTQPFAGSRCPVTAAVAQLRMKQNQYQEALQLYTIAQRSVPQYTSWFLEYTYYRTFCQQKLNEPLSATERQQVQDAIKQGRFLSQHRTSEDEFTERYTGLLHLVQHQYADAIPFLAASRRKLSGLDLAATDQALILCYLQTGQSEKAVSLANEGIAKGGEYSASYRAMLKALPDLEKSIKRQTNAIGGPPG